MNDIEASVKELLDRQRIWECLLRYTRGVDRLDRPLMLSAFHEQALIVQGGFKGSREDLADWVLTYHQENQLFTQHLMTNHCCEIDGDTAHSETHVVYYGTNPEVAEKDAFAVGRYIDRLQRADNAWVIANRVCTTEGTTDFLQNGLMAQFKPAADSIARASRDRNDPSYLRPLVFGRD